MWRNGAVPRPVPPVVLGAPEPDDRPVLWVVGIDPGGTSGWAVLRIEWDRVGEGIRARGCWWRTGEVQGPEPYQAEALLAIVRSVYLAGMWEGGSEADRCVVSVERFTLRLLSMDAALLSPVRITAMMEALSWRGLPFPVVQLQPSEAKKVVTDERLQHWGFWPSGAHARDALRHAVLTARKMGSEEQFRASVCARMSWLVEEVD